MNSLPCPPKHPVPLSNNILTRPITIWQGLPKESQCHSDIQKWCKDTMINISKPDNHRISLPCELIGWEMCCMWTLQCSRGATSSKIYRWPALYTNTDPLSEIDVSLWSSSVTSHSWKQKKVTVFTMEVVSAFCLNHIYCYSIWESHD